MQILDQAIAMENRGEALYHSLAQQAGATPLGRAFLYLAGQEKKHAQLLDEHRRQGVVARGTDYSQRAEAVIDSFHAPKADIPAPLTIADIYYQAREVETQSILMYQQLAQQADSDAARELFLFLAGQEEKHYSLIGGMYEFLNRPNEWVEDAEFGLRPEY